MPRGSISDAENDSEAGSEVCSSETFSFFSLASAASSAASSKPQNHDATSFSSTLACIKSSIKWRAALMGKKKRTAVPVLEDEDVSFLVNNTAFTENDIREWWREFIMDCPEGVLTKEKVLEMLLFILPRENGHIVAELIFTAFDKDQNGRIDFNEFIIATHCTATSSPADKLHWVFQMYDKDNSKTIQLSEMVELFGTLYLSEGLAMEAAVERAQRIFSTLDIDSDGDVTEDEFVNGCLQDFELVEALSEDKTRPPLALPSSESTPRRKSSRGI